MGSCLRAGVGGINPNDLCNNAADLRRRVELTFALAAFCGKMTHQVFVGIAQNVVTLCPVLAEVQRLVLKNGD